MPETPDIVEKLFPDRLIEAELMTEVCQPLRRHAVLADPDLDRIARHQPDGDESQEHQRQKGRDGQRDAAKEIGEHGRSENDGLRPWRDMGGARTGVTGGRRLRRRAFRAGFACSRSRWSAWIRTRSN